MSDLIFYLMTFGPFGGMAIGAGLFAFQAWREDSAHLRFEHPGCQCPLCHGHRGNL